MAALFIALSPGVLMRFPKNCSKLVVAATHGAAFVAIFWLTHKFVWNLGRRMGYEGFQNMAAMPPMPPMPPTPPKPPMLSIDPASAAAANSAAVQAISANPPMPPANGPMPMPAAPIQSASGSSNLAAMNIMISTGSGKAGNPCKNGNDCASGMCMGAKCM